MNYFIKRDLNEFGPYTLADLQRYVAQGNIVMGDLARSEGLTDWVPISRVLGNIPVPVPVTPAVAGAAPGAAPAQALAPTGYADPPNLHWSLVLLLHIVTLTLFGLVWMFVEAGWMKRVKPSSQALLYWGLAVGGFVGSEVLAVASDSYRPLAGFVRLGSIVLLQVGNFKFRDDLEEYYNTVEPIHLQLSGGMTFFFSFIYFQYHFNRICRWKKTGVLDP